MKQLYNFRLDPDLINELDKLEGNRTYNLTEALHLYLQKKHDSSYGVTTIDFLKLQLDDLKADKDRLIKQNELLILSSLSFWTKFKMKLLKS